MLRIGKPTAFAKSYLAVPAGSAWFSDFQYCREPGTGGVCANGRPDGAIAAGSVYESRNPLTRTWGETAAPVKAVPPETVFAAVSNQISIFHPGFDSFCTVPRASRFTASSGK